MKFQIPSFKFYLNGRTNKRTSRKQYASHFFKVGGHKKNGPSLKCQIDNGLKCQNDNNSPKEITVSKDWPTWHGTKVVIFFIQKNIFSEQNRQGKWAGGRGGGGG